MDAAHPANGTVIPFPGRGGRLWPLVRRRSLARIGAQIRIGTVRSVRFRASEVAAATGGHLVGDDVELDGASFDSRSLQRGQLFVPLVADRDGHDFIAAAARGGA